MIEFKFITKKTNWEKFVASHQQANFLQSYNWGLFEEKLGKRFFAIAIFENQQQIGAAMVIKEKAKRGDYLTIAGGPLINWESKKISLIFKQFCDFILRLAKKEDCHFVRVRPQAQDSPQLRLLFQNNHFKPAPMHLTADLTLRLDLTQADEQLLTQMRKNTRYEIKKAQRMGIVTKIIQDSSFMDQFHSHQLYLANKHHFVPFEYNFLLEQFKAFAKDNQVAFVNSYYQQQLLASAFVIFYHNEAVYHYGVSTPANEKLPGSYATQWAAIKEARERGCAVYNFWGVSPIQQKSHRFAGPSLFKRGFGGYELQHLPAHDLPTSKIYPLIRTFELLRKKTRNL